MIRKIQLLFYELHIVFPRFKFWRICRALDIKPYKWQRDYALGIEGLLQYPPGRATGKTMAVMLRVLMVNPNKPFGIEKIMRQDPDFDTRSRHRMLWYEGEYKRLAHKCVKAHIPVPIKVDFFYMTRHEKYNI